jgi:hypothetical protein
MDSLLHKSAFAIAKISLGVICGSLAHSLFFPHNGLVELPKRIEKTLGKCRKWLADDGAGRPCAASDRRPRRTLMDFVMQSRNPHRATLASIPIFGVLSGCSGAPSQNILGSYFPSWMICALLWILLAVATRRVLVLVGIDKAIPLPLLVYLAFAVFFAFAVWLIWLG